MSTRDPRRWLETGSDTPEGLGELLAAARRETPSAERLSAIGASLTAATRTAIETGAGVSGAAPARGSEHAGPTGGVGGTLPKLGALATAVGVGFWLVAQPSPPTAPTRDAAGARETTSAPAPAPERAPATGTDSAAASTQELGERSRNGLDPASATDVDRATATTDSTATSTTPAVPQAARATAAVGATPTSDELQLLQRARQALRTRPARALSLTGRHARAHPGSAFAQERERIAIEALEALGRGDALRARAADFLERYPSSSHAPRVRAWLEEAGGAAP